jgi:hypothetical protein
MPVTVHRYAQLLSEVHPIRTEISAAQGLNQVYAVDIAHNVITMALLECESVPLAIYLCSTLLQRTMLYSVPFCSVYIKRRSVMRFLLKTAEVREMSGV